MEFSVSNRFSFAFLSEDCLLFQKMHVVLDCCSDVSLLKKTIKPNNTTWYDKFLPKISSQLAIVM